MYHEFRKDLKLRFLENLEIPGIALKCLEMIGRYSANHPKVKLWQLCYKIAKSPKSEVKQSIEKPTLLYFVDVSTIFCPMLSGKQHSFSSNSAQIPLNLRVKYKFGIKNCSNWSRAPVMWMFFFSLLKADRFWSFRQFSKKLKLKGKFLDNHRKNICSFFSHFTRISVHHKWKETRLLSAKGEFTGCVTSCETTYDLGS